MSYPTCHDVGHKTYEENLPFRNFASPRRARFTVACEPEPFRREPFYVTTRRSTTQDKQLFRRVLFVAIFVLNWLAINSAVSVWCGLSWPLSVPLVALYAISEIWHWPWWALGLIVIVHLEYYSRKYAK